ncbi:MAG TPA: SAF domain-containing protein [Streptosporangiaceae bacterium]|nr:SAF domain-containing protein [Streptosporangiaceae bacterium]
MSRQPRAGIGTAYFPTTDVPRNGNGQLAGPAGQLRGLPRRRRPAMLALAIALAGTGVLVSVAVYQRADHQVPVVMVTSAVPAYGVITAGDLGIADVTVPAGVHVIPGSQLGQVAGELAAVTLRPGTLLAPADLTSSQPPGPGQVLVPVPLKPESLPASGLVPGDRVLIVATPGDQGQQASSSGAAELTSPVPAVVEAVNLATDQDGFDVIDLLVASSSGQAVAAQASTGQFALILTSRGG